MDVQTHPVKQGLQDIKETLTHFINLIKQPEITDAEKKAWINTAQAWVNGIPDLIDQV